MRIHLRAEFAVPDIPPSPNELKGLHPMVLYKRVNPIKQLTWTLAQSARNRAGWPLPASAAIERARRQGPPAPRWVGITLHLAKLRDKDNLVASVKPVIDALKGVLVVDDSEEWLALYGVRQMQTAGAALQRTVITVWLAQPPEIELEHFRPENEAISA